MPAPAARKVMVTVVGTPSIVQRHSIRFGGSIAITSAVDEAAPRARVEVERATDLRLEVGGHQPLRERGGVDDRVPDPLDRVRELDFVHDGPVVFDHDRSSRCRPRRCSDCAQ